MEKLLLVFIHLLACSPMIQADLIQACITGSAPAGSDGLIMSAAASQTGSNCQLNLTGIPSNSWIRFRLEIRDASEHDCEQAENWISGCSTVEFDRCEHDKTLICVIDEGMFMTGNTVQLDLPRMFAEQDGHPRVLMSYAVALALPLGDGETRNATVTGDHGYVVSHSKYLSDDLEMADSTIRIKFQLEDYPFAISLEFLAGKLKKDRNKNLIQINTEPRINDIDKVSSTHIIVSSDDTKSLSLRLVADNSMKDHGFLLQYKVVKLFPKQELIITTKGIRTTTSAEAKPGETSPHTTGSSAVATESLMSMNTAAEISFTESNFVTEDKEALTDKSTIISLTAICIVLGLLLVIVIIVFSLLLARAYKLSCNSCFGRPEGGEKSGAHNAAYAFTAAVDGQDGNREDHNYCYVDQQLGRERAPDGGYTIPTSARAETHVYAKTGEQGAEYEDTPGEPDNEYHLADNPSAPVYHALEPSAPAAALQIADSPQPPSLYSLADDPDQQETTVRRADEANGYVDTSKLTAVEHVRQSACSLEEDHAGNGEGPKQEVKLISNDLYISSQNSV